MAFTGIGRLDALFDGDAGAKAVTEEDSGEVVGVIQELLRNHDLRKVPGPRHVAEPAWPGGETFGQFGVYTKKAVRYFQKKHGLPVESPPVVDIVTMRRLVLAKASKPTQGRAYLTRKLDFDDTVLGRVATLICSWEESSREGGFRNWKPQDAADAPKTGLSYGLLQWTHGSTRLGDVLERFHQLAPTFESAFGITAAGATEMIAHAKAGSAALADNGDPANPAMARLNFQKLNLWKAKFVSVGESIAFQILQVEQALADLRAIHAAKHGEWTKITYERGWGFMLDLANQRGIGGANSRYNDAVAALPAGTEAQILEHIENAEVANYKPRRHFFRVDSPLLADQNFPENP